MTSPHKPDLIIDIAYRLPKPKGIPESAPRDVIMRLHFYHIKEELMQAARKTPFQKVKLFADLSPFTVLAREKLQQITSALRQHDNLYKWGFLTKIIITRN